MSYGTVKGSFTGGGEVDLLAKSGRGFSLLTATAFIVGEVAGGGILSLPHATAGASWAGLGMILYCAVCAGVSGLCLARSWILLENRYEAYRHGLTRKPFATIGLHAFGTWMSVFVSFLLNVTRIGVTTVFLILTSKLIVSLTKSFWPSMTLCHWIPIVAAVLVIPFWLGSPADFWPIAYAAMLSTIVGSVLLIIEIILTVARRGWGSDFHVESFESFSGAFGTILFAFGGASAFPNFQNDMKKKEKFPLAVILGFLGLILLYLPTAGLGYGAFGHSVKDSILDNVEQNALVTVINVFFFIHCLTVIMIVINPVYLDLEEVLSIPKDFNWKRCVFRTSLLVLVVLIGETFPNFGEILDLIGGSTVTLMAFVMPPIFYVKLARDETDSAWPKEKISPYMMALYGVIVVSGTVGGVSSTYSVLKGWSPLGTSCWAGQSSHHHLNSTGNTNETAAYFY